MGMLEQVGFHPWPAILGGIAGALNALLLLRHRRGRRAWLLPGTAGFASHDVQPRTGHQAASFSRLSILGLALLLATSTVQAQVLDQPLERRLREIEGRQWLIVAFTLYQTLLVPYPDWCQQDVQGLALVKNRERDSEHRDRQRDLQEVVTSARALMIEKCPEATGMTVRLGSGDQISDQVADAPGFIVRLREPIPVVPKGGYRCGASPVAVDVVGETTRKLVARVPAGHDPAATREAIRCAALLAADSVSKSAPEGREPARLEIDVEVDGRIVQVNTLERRYGWQYVPELDRARAAVHPRERLATEYADFKDPLLLEYVHYGEFDLVRKQGALLSGILFFSYVWAYSDHYGELLPAGSPSVGLLHTEKDSFNFVKKIGEYDIRMDRRFETAFRGLIGKVIGIASFRAAHDMEILMRRYPPEGRVLRRFSENVWRLATNQPPLGLTADELTAPGLTSDGTLVEQKVLPFDRFAWDAAASRLAPASLQHVAIGEARDNGHFADVVRAMYRYRKADGTDGGHVIYFWYREVPKGFETSLHRLSPSNSTLIELSTAVTTPPTDLSDALRLAEKVWYSPSRTYRGGGRDVEAAPPAVSPPRQAAPAPPPPPPAPPDTAGGVQRVPARQEAERPGVQEAPRKVQRDEKLDLSPEPNPEPEDSGPPAARIQRLQPGSPVSGRVDAARGAEFEIELAAPAVILFDIVSASERAVYALTAPSGATVFREEGSDAGPFQLGETGVYRLSVEALEGKAADFELRIVRLR